MAILKDIEVRIARNTSGKARADDAGDALQEYQIPTATGSGSSDSVEKYIEAVTGQAFQIEVYFEASFEFYDADGITVGLEIDNRTVYSDRHYSKLQVEQRRKAGKPLVVSSLIGVESDRCFEWGFAFGSLHLGEHQ